MRDYDLFEYRTTRGPRKAWDGSPDLTKEGWEPDPDEGRPGESFDRFDYHEERYWRRLRRNLLDPGTPTPSESDTMGDDPPPSKLPDDASEVRRLLAVIRGQFDCMFERAAESNEVCGGCSECLLRQVRAPSVPVGEAIPYVGLEMAAIVLAAARDRGRTNVAVRFRNGRVVTFSCMTLLDVVRHTRGFLDRGHERAALHEFLKKYADEPGLR